MQSVKKAESVVLKFSQIHRKISFHIPRSLGKPGVVLQKLHTLCKHLWIAHYN